MDPPSGSNSNQIYDIYVIKASGIPLFAGCTATDYCMSHLDQHELIAGFFSAMFSFSAESFSDDTLETMVYGDILLNFEFDREHDLIFAFIHDRDSDNKIIREQLNRAHDVFIDEYRGNFDTFSVDQSIFEDYRKILNEKGIINTNLVDTSAMANTLKDDHEDKRSRLVSWIKGLFNL